MHHRPLGLGLLLALWIPVAAGALDAPTWNTDVAPILYANCIGCHSPNQVGPMSLRTYDEVRPWAKAIAKAVEARTMPPWHAAPEFHGVFANERTLTDGEIATLVSWSAQGARRGDPDDAPAPREFPQTDGWSIGEPDMVVSFPEPYYVADSVDDLYANIYVALPEAQLPVDRWIQAMEFRPGSEAVHHIVIYTDDYRESLGFPMGMLGGMGPGTDPTVFPEGFGRRLAAGTNLMFNMHYHKESGPGTAVYDQSSIAFKFHDKPVKHEVNWGAVGTMGFAIPPYAENHAVTASERVREDSYVLALFPHTHLRGKASKYVAYYPDGREEVLLHVPHYDFNWQTNYVFKEPKFLPAGTEVEVTMWYDNSEARAKIAGFDPSRYVHWGEPTTSEMMYGWMDYCSAKPMAD